MFSPQGSIVLKALIQALSLQTSLIFYPFHWLDSDIRGDEVFLLEVPIQASLDPAGGISRMWVLNLLCNDYVVMPTYWALHLLHVIT